MPAAVYIDGFALYHTCFRGPTKKHNAYLKWIDFRALADRLLPDEDVVLIRYYTARVGDTPEDLRRASRQDAFIRAVNSQQGVVVHEGKFHKNKRDVRLAHCPPGIEPVQTAWIQQEKGSDVALATHLLLDAVDGTCDVSLLVTNDSDFIEPIRVVKERFKNRVIVISPDTVVSRMLASVASFARPLDKTLLAECQMPDIVTDPDGRRISRPKEWTDPNLDVLNA